LDSWDVYKKKKGIPLVGPKDKYNHYYENIDSKWTPIEPIIKDIKVDKSQSFIITRIQFPIQLAIARTIHCF